MKKTILIGGVVTLVTIISLFVNTGCRDGWKEGEGEYLGYHSCKTKSGLRYEMCFKVYNSSNTENYWCVKGEVEIPEIPNIPQVKQSGNREICTPKGCNSI